MNEQIDTPALPLSTERVEPSPVAPQQHRSTAREMRVLEINSALAPAYEKAGTLELSEGERKDLTAEYPDDMVETRPHDGLFYIPHIHISDRLTRIFGPGKWTMLRRWENIENNMIYAEWVMIIRGVYIGESIGASKYHPNNPQQNYSDALESTRGEAIRRIAAKYLACGSQVWNPAYCRKLKAGPVARPTPKTTPTPRQAPNRAPEVKAAAKTADVVPPPKEATTETLKWFCAKVEGEGLLQEMLAYAIDKGWILPNESLDSMPLRHVPTTKPSYMELTRLVEDYSLGKSGLAPEQKGDADFSEAFWDVIITVPRKGMKKADYIREPDTIKSLYCATKTGDEEAQNRLFGMANKWKPEPYEYNGKTYQPSDADHKCRAALDDFLSWETERKTS